MNEVMKTILHRRSIRNFSKESVEEALLDQVLLAGQYAPSGGNCQYCRFTVIENDTVLQGLKKVVEQAFAQMELFEGLYKSKATSIRLSKAGGYDFIFGAPVLIVVSNQKGHGNAMADSAAATENMLLAADSLGLGACWVNQLNWLSENETVRAYLKETCGIQEDEVICTGIALGVPKDGPYPQASERKGNLIRKIQ